MNLAEQVDYKKESVLYPQYRYLRLYQQTNSTDQTISVSGGDRSTFQIPVCVHNWARSYLSFKMAPASGVAGYYNYFYKDCLSPIRNLILQPQSGREICRIEDVANFTHIVWKPCTAYDKYKSFSLFSNNSGVGHMFRRNNEPSSSSFPTGSYVSSTTAPTLTINFGGSTFTFTSNFATSSFNVNLTINQRRTNNGNASDAIDEPQYLEVGAALNDTTPVLNIRIPLSMIYYTIFALDKDIYFPQVMYLYVDWNPSTKILWNSSLNTNPTTGAVAATANVKLEKLYLYLAVEQNENIVNTVKADVQAGRYKIYIPWVERSKQGLTAGSTSNAQVQYNSNQGINLCCVFWSYFNNTESSYTAYDTSNINDAGATDQKIQLFYTTLDNKRLNDWDIDISEYDHYFLQEEKLKGSVILSANMYDYNFFWCDSWIGTQPYHVEKDMIFKYAVGIPLNVQRIYQINVPAQANAAYQLYIYGVFQRELTITPSAIELI